MLLIATDTYPTLRPGKSGAPPPRRSRLWLHTDEVTMSTKETSPAAAGPQDDNVLQTALASIGDAVIVTDGKGRLRSSTRLPKR